MRDVDTTKAAGIDRLYGRFLKDGADVLAKPVTDICNLSVSLNKSPNAFKLATVEPIFKKGKKKWCVKIRTYLLTATTFKDY